MMSRILTLLFCTAALSFKCMGSDDLIIVGLFKDVERYEYKDNYILEDEIGVENSYDVAGLEQYLGSAYENNPEAKFIKIPAEYRDLVKMLITFTDLNPRGIFVIPLDYNLTGHMMNCALYHAEDYFTTSPTNKIHSIRLPYILAWMQANKEYITDDFIGEYLDYKKVSDELFKSIDCNQVAMDLLLNTLDQLLNDSQSAEFVKSYLANYDRAFELRRKFFKGKYGN